MEFTRTTESSTATWSLTVSSRSSFTQFSLFIAGTSSSVASPLLHYIPVTKWDRGCVPTRKCQPIYCSRAGISGWGTTGDVDGMKNRDYRWIFWSVFFMNLQIVEIERQAQFVTGDNLLSLKRRPHCRSCLHHHYKSLEYDGIVCCPILVSVTESITSSPPVKQFISYVSSNNSHVVLEWNCVGRSVLLHECVPLDILGILSHANRSFRLFQILLRVLDILLLLPCPIARPTHKCNCAYILVRHHPTNQSSDGPHKRITIGYVGGGFACPWQVWILARKGHGQGSMTGS